MNTVSDYQDSQPDLLINGIKYLRLRIFPVADNSSLTCRHNGAIMPAESKVEKVTKISLRSTMTSQFPRVALNLQRLLCFD